MLSPKNRGEQGEHQEAAQQGTDKTAHAAQDHDGERDQDKAIAHQRVDVIRRQQEASRRPQARQRRRFPIALFFLSSQTQMQWHGWLWGGLENWRAAGPDSSPDVNSHAANLK